MVVIGGGCVGAGVAWEAATRGLKVALVERDDFASGTSGRSTKLIHGGIRYLEAAFMKADTEMYEMVQEALSERAHLLNAAPFMTHALPIIIPLYTWWEIPYMWAGAKVYDLVAGARRAVPKSYYIGRDEALFQFPMLKADGLKGAVVYYDGMHNDTRMNLLIALTACQHGAAVANYVETVGITHEGDGAAAATSAGASSAESDDGAAAESSASSAAGTVAPAAPAGRANGVKVRDVRTGEAWTIKAKGVVNATGCFGDAVRLMDNPSAVPLIVGAAGTHVVLPDHFSPDNMGLIVPKTRDGRVLFFLPWEGMTICGTTDSPSDITMTPAPTDEDVKFIIEESNRYLNRKISLEDVRAAWSGIRPLIKDPAKLAAGSSTAQLSRKHVVEVSPSGMVSILGGKWTTYRRMAEDAVDAFAAAQKLPVDASKTVNMQLLGADRAGIVFNQRYDRIPITLRETFGFDKDVARHLSRNYGTRALQVGQIVRLDEEAGRRAGGTAAHAGGLRGYGRRLVPRHPFIAAEVVFAVEQEYAVTIVDVLARRTRLSFMDAAAAREATPAVASIMANLLGWDAAKTARETAAAYAFLDTMITPSSAAVSSMQSHP